MSVDYIVSSLPALAFGAPAPISWERFSEIAGAAAVPPPEWGDLETQLRNAVAEARGGAKWKRPADGCSLFWRGRVLACFQEKDVARRDEMLDRVWWDAAGELTSPASPLGRGALATYAVRLRIALRRSAISASAGAAAFDRMTSATSKVI
ncbi:MAG: hypothetical protein IJI73_11430 [Kiritimatiellae bacterium]|nr:hypothetical protein [Kiritimatiellia bacterium]